MKLWIAGRVALFAAMAACSEPTEAEAQERRLLVFSKTAGFRHSSIAPAIAALRARAAEEGVLLDATEDARAFTRANLARYDAVVFLSTTGDVLDAAQQSALEAYVRSGGGFVGVHSASDTEYDWPWYGELVGAYFASHPPGTPTATLLVMDPDHPATVGLPNPWIRADEWYDLRDLKPGLSVLVAIDETTYKARERNPAPAPRPIAWHRSFDGGRSFYTGLGHTDASWSEPLFLDHVWGGISWAMGP
jgi:type 1 glutamine amidotransferase